MVLEVVSGSPTPDFCCTGARPATHDPTKSRRRLGGSTAQCVFHAQNPPVHTEPRTGVQKVAPGLSIQKLTDDGIVTSYLQWYYYQVGLCEMVLWG